MRLDPSAGLTRYVVFDTTELPRATRHLHRTSGLLLASALLALVGAAGLSQVVARRLSQSLEQLVARVALASTNQGRIVIHVVSEAYSSSETGVGFGRSQPEHMGFGIGLSFVKRRAHRHNGP